MTQTLEHTLQGFTGTEQYYVVSRIEVLRLLATDGVKYLCEQAQCYWLMDVILSHAPALRKAGEEFAIAELRVKNSEGGFLLHDGNEPARVYARQRIPYTDFPLAEIKLYVAAQGRNDFVVCLPSEY